VQAPVLPALSLYISREAKMEKLVVERIAIDDLQLDPNNARKHSEKNINAICESLKQFGQRKPIVINANDVVIAGNGTVEAARKLKIKALDVVRVPADWSEEKIKAYALADNRTAELASWDAEILLSQLNELNIADWDINALGFKEFELNPLKDSDADTNMKDLGERYEVVIECADENEQTALLLRLSQDGLKVRAIII
jgi:ParB-like chromosome segregation protein Spo0J